MDPITSNITWIGAQEWREKVFVRYVINPLDLTHHCDDFGVGFSATHTLNCKKGGLITSQQNDLHDGVVDLECKALT